MSNPYESPKTHQAAETDGNARRRPSILRFLCASVLLVGGLLLSLVPMGIVALYLCFFLFEPDLFDNKPITPLELIGGILLAIAAVICLGAGRLVWKGRSLYGIVCVIISGAAFAGFLAFINMPREWNRFFGVYDIFDLYRDL